MTSRSFTTTLQPGEGVGRIVLPFDPKAVFGTTRAPLAVTVNGHSYRSTVAAMGGAPFVPFRKSHRDAAGVREGDSFAVTLTLDVAPRTVDPPDDLAAALHAADAWPRWEALSYTAKRELAEAVEQAKKPETRARRIEKAVAALKA
ncbi:MAG: DUF1905 domain-containing protein [Sphingomonadaceae bacterium]|nr:DUF1905 domain-containing protein [Sphingomonadaceae bacterium]